MIALRTEIPFHYISETYCSGDIYLEERQSERKERRRMIRSPYGPEAQLHDERFLPWD